jgi:hypothetical protein
LWPRLLSSWGRVNNVEQVFGKGFMEFFAPSDETPTIKAAECGPIRLAFGFLVPKILNLAISTAKHPFGKNLTSQQNLWKFQYHQPYKVDEQGKSPCAAPQLNAKPPKQRFQFL